MDARAAWASWAPLAGFLLATLLASNAVAGCLARARARCVEDKLGRLATGGGGGGSGGPPAGAAPVPVTLLVGWLGAGKTTVLNRLLAAPGGRRLCVIENEAGSVSIDHALLAAPPGAPAGGGAPPPGGVIVLKNGCLCCSAGGGRGGGEEELERVLDRLLALQAQAHAFDHVVIEASGLADPAPLVAAFFGARLGARYALDSVVAVVDAQHIGRHLDGRGLLPRARDAGRQVAYADTVLLAKTDVATPAQAAAARAAVRAVNPTARLVDCVRGAVDTGVLLGARCFDVDRAAALLALDRRGGEGGGCGGVAASHDREIGTVTLQPPLRGGGGGGRAPLALAPLQAWLQELLSTRGDDLFRVKGLLWVTPAPGQRARLFVVQGVHAELHAAFLAGWPEQQEEEDGGYDKQQLLLQQPGALEAGVAAAGAGRRGGRRRAGSSQLPPAPLVAKSGATPARRASRHAAGRTNELLGGGAAAAAADEQQEEEDAMAPLHALPPPPTLLSPSSSVLASPASRGSARRRRGLLLPLGAPAAVDCAPRAAGGGSRHVHSRACGEGCAAGNAAAASEVGGAAAVVEPALVLIGRRLHRAALEQAFAACATG